MGDMNHYNNDATLKLFGGDNTVDPSYNLRPKEIDGMKVGVKSCYIYDPEKVPKAIVELMSKGWSKCGVAVHFGITLRTLLDWATRYPEAGEALEMGEEAAKAFYEMKAMEHLVVTKDSPKVDPHMLTFLTRRFADKSQYLLVEKGEDSPEAKRVIELTQIIRSEEL